MPLCWAIVMILPRRGTDGLVTDDVDVIVTCGNNCRSAGNFENRRNVCVFLSFCLHCQCNQLQTSPAVTRSHREVRTIAEIARGHNVPLFVIQQSNSSVCNVLRYFDIFKNCCTSIVLQS